jgi:hypothetical protein
MAHIRIGDSIRNTNTTAFEATGPDTFILDAGAYLITDSGAIAVNLHEAWTVEINGEIGSFEHHEAALRLTAASDTTLSTVVIGKTGDVTGRDSGGGFGILSDHALTLTNFGTIGGGGGSEIGSAIFASGVTSIVNAGSIVGNVFTGAHEDHFTDFKKVVHSIKNGVVNGTIDLGDGDDHFKGGASAETVRDGGGSDTYSLGGGNDTFLAVKDDLRSPGTDLADHVDGGTGIDTYDLKGATGTLVVNLDSKVHFGNVAPHTAFVLFGPMDTVLNFENVNGGASADNVFGSSAKNVLDGGAGADVLAGGGGRDILTGGDDADAFVFTKLSDSGLTASSRDLITDFVRTVDLIDLSSIETAIGHNFTFIEQNFFSHTAGQLRETYSGGNTIVWGDVNGDNKADFSIALEGHFLLRQSDFL